MSTPIGSLEFIVKFDSMQDQFVDALKDALEQAELDFDSETITKIEEDVSEIKYNIRNRLRGTISSNRAQLEAVGIPELRFLAEEANIQAFADILERSKTGKRLYGKQQGETEKEHRARLFESAQTTFGTLGWYIGQAMEDPKFHAKNIGKIKLMQRAIDMAMETSWENMITLTGQMIDETEMKKHYHDWLSRRGAKFASGERRWERLTRPIGSGLDPLTQDIFFEELAQLDLTPEQAEEIIHGKPKVLDDPKIVSELMSWLKKFTIPAGKIRLPGTILKTLEAEIESLSAAEQKEIGGGGKIYDPGARGFKLVDVLPLATTEEIFDTIMEGLKEHIKDPKRRDKFEEEAEDFFREAGYWIAPSELGRFVGSGKEAEKKWMGAGKGLFVGTSAEVGQTEATHAIFPRLGGKMMPSIRGLEKGAPERTVDILFEQLDSIKTLLQSTKAQLDDVPEETIEKLEEEMEDVSRTLDEGL